MVKMEINYEEEVKRLAAFLETEKLVIFSDGGVVEKDFIYSINNLTDTDGDYFSIDFLFNVRHELVVRGLMKNALRIEMDFRQMRQLLQGADGLILSSLSRPEDPFFSIAGFNIYYAVSAFDLLEQKVAFIPEIDCSLVTFSP